MREKRLGSTREVGFDVSTEHVREGQGETAWEMAQRRTQVEVTHGDKEEWGTLTFTGCADDDEEMDFASLGSFEISTALKTDETGGQPIQPGRTAHD